MEQVDQIEGIIDLTPRCLVCGVKEGKVLQRIVSKRVRKVRATLISDGRCKQCAEKGGATNFGFMKTNETGEDVEFH